MLIICLVSCFSLGFSLVPVLDFEFRCFYCDFTFMKITSVFSCFVSTSCIFALFVQFILSLVESLIQNINTFPLLLNTCVAFIVDVGYLMLTLPPKPMWLNCSA